MRIFGQCLAGCGALLLLLLTGIPAAAQTDNLLPRPASIQYQAGYLPLAGFIRPEVQGPADQAVTQALTSIRKQLAARAMPDDQALALTIRYQQAGRPGSFDSERYTLRVTPSGVLLEAPTSLGVLRGLATLAQLPRREHTGQWVLPCVDIADQPRFRWRGLLLDPARHFLPVPVIKRNIDGMAAVKLNVLHWHLSDDQGWRVESRRFPRLQAVAGATGYYTQAEVREVVRYAAARGIRVVPEFDLPGHTGALLAAYPRLASNDSIRAVPTRWGVLNIALDPTRESTYTLLDSLLTEMAGLFPDPYFHIGGDENDGRQWRHSPRIVAFMRAQKMLKPDGKSVDKHQLQTYFNRRLLPILRKNNKTMVGWDEILGPDLPAGIVIQSWRGKKGLAEAVQLGHPALLSNGYYIDLNQPAATHYAADPLPAGTTLTATQQALVLGGEATMWDEFADSVIVDSRIWPRAAAVAERLWSPAATTQSPAELYRRLPVLSEQLEALGLRHRHAPAQLLRQLTAPADAAPLQVLAAVLEPVKDYKRHFQGFKYSTLTPLTRLVDAVPAESEAARLFGAAVDTLLAPATAPAARQRQYARLRLQLLPWQANDTRLQPLFVLRPELREYQPLSVSLAALATLALERLTQLETSLPASPEWLAKAGATLTAAQAPAGQAELALVPAVRRLAGLP